MGKWACWICKIFANEYSKYKKNGNKGIRTKVNVQSNSTKDGRTDCVVGISVNVCEGYGWRLFIKRGAGKQGKAGCRRFSVFACVKKKIFIIKASASKAIWEWGQLLVDWIEAAKHCSLSAYAGSAWTYGKAPTTLRLAAESGQLPSQWLHSKMLTPIWASTRSRHIFYPRGFICKLLLAFLIQVARSIRIQHFTSLAICTLKIHIWLSLYAALADIYYFLLFYLPPNSFRSCPVVLFGVPIKLYPFVVVSLALCSGMCIRFSYIYTICL